MATASGSAAALAAGPDTQHLFNPYQYRWLALPLSEIFSKRPLVLITRSNKIGTKPIHAVLGANGWSPLTGLTITTEC